MSRIFVKTHPNDRNYVIADSKLPTKSSGEMSTGVAVCNTFATDLGILPGDMKGDVIVEYELTVKEVTRYKLAEESPWKPVTA
jgi:hypothetical protein